MNNSLLYIEGNAGASGDMILAALVNLGFPIKKLNETLKLLHPGLGASLKQTAKHGFAAPALDPILPKSKEKVRTLSDFLTLIEKSKLSQTFKEKTAELMNRLAECESKIHLKPKASLHFHELGGWDTLLDLVGIVAGLQHFGFPEIRVGPLNVGGGKVKTEHGLLPVPVPAVCELLKGFTLYSSGEEAELVTPTGALILSTFGKPVERFPRMIMANIGSGAGSATLSFPNILRMFLGDAAQEMHDDRILKLETNIDDMNPQFWEHVFEKLYESGAFEVFLTPVVMKKSRPAHVLTVLAPAESENKLTQILFEETTTLGIRREVISRITLSRKTIQVPTPYGDIPCKVGYSNGTTFNIVPEYEALKMVSRDRKLPLKKLYEIVVQSLPAE